MPRARVAKVGVEEPYRVGQQPDALASMSDEHERKSFSICLPAAARRPRLSTETVQVPVTIPANAGAIAAYLEKRRRTERFSLIIDPRKSRLMSAWDILMLWVLFFLAAVTPIEVAFIPPATEYNSLFWINRAADTCFIIDMVLNFLIMYMEQDVNGTHWVRSPRRIAWHYVTTWFPLDLLAMAPSAVDFLNKGEDVSYGDEEHSEETARNLLMLRVIRALRLMKLLRLVRATRVIKRWAARISLDTGTIIMVKCLIKVLLACHGFSCAFRISANFADGPSATWMATFGYCAPESDARPADGAGFTLFGPAYDRLVCLDPTGMYIVAFYWSVMIITGSGGTDFYASQFTVAEAALVMTLVLLGAIIWTDVLASFCDIATNSDPAETEYNQTLDDLNRFMAQCALPRKMREALREYFHQTRHLNHAAAARAVFHKMSPELCQSTALYCFGMFFQRIELLQKSLEEKCLVKLALNMHAVVMPPSGEGTITEIEADVLYLINKGTVLSNARALGTGDHFNACMLLANPHLRKPQAARAITYLELYAISWEVLSPLLDEFPDSRKALRKFTVLLGVRRALTWTMHLVRARKVLNKRGGKVSSEEIFRILVGVCKGEYSKQLQGEAAEVIEKRQSLSRSLSQRNMAVVDTVAAAEGSTKDGGGVSMGGMKRAMRIAIDEAMEQSHSKIEGLVAQLETRTMARMDQLSEVLLKRLDAMNDAAGVIGF